MVFIIGFIPLAFFVLLYRSKKKGGFYYQSIFFFIFSILLLGQRGIWEYPISLPGYIPPIVILWFYLIMVTLFVKIILGKISTNRPPLFKIIVVFIFAYTFAGLHGFYNTDDLPRYIRSFAVYSVTGIIFFIICSLGDSVAVIKKYYYTLCLALLIISIVYILIYFFHIPIKGVAGSLQRELGTRTRLVWGGQGPWIATIIILNILFFKSLKPKTKCFSIILLILGMNLILISQTRTLIIFLILPLMLIYYQRGIRLFFLRIVLIFSIFFLVFSFLSDTEYMGNKVGRFFKYDDILHEETNYQSTITYENAPNKLRPFLWSVYKTNTILDFLFGHGLAFKEYSGRKHYHSGIGFVYGSMGIIGVSLLLILFVRIQTYYRKYIDYKRNDLNSVLIELILANFIVTALISPITGILIQELSFFYHGLSLAILEMARRNIVKKQYINKI